MKADFGATRVTSDVHLRNTAMGEHCSLEVVEDAFLVGLLGKQVVERDLDRCPAGLGWPILRRARLTSLAVVVSARVTVLVVVTLMVVTLVVVASMTGVIVTGVIMVVPLVVVTGMTGVVMTGVIVADVIVVATSVIILRTSVPRLLSLRLRTLALFE